MSNPSSKNSSTVTTPSGRPKTANNKGKRVKDFSKLNLRPDSASDKNRPDVKNYISENKPSFEKNADKNSTDRNNENNDKNPIKTKSSKDIN